MKSTHIKQGNTTNATKYLFLPYRTRTVGKDIVVTNDYYDWIILKPEEYHKICSKSVIPNSPLYQKLKSNNFILTKNTLPLHPLLLREQNRIRGILSGPSLHIIVLTKRCNQKCVYCHAMACDISNAKKYDLSKEHAKKYVDLIFTSPSSKITIEFQGGEPLLNFEILQYITEYSHACNNALSPEKKKDLVLCVVTNLEAMTDEILEYLITHKIGICTSLDGPQELHDANRPSYQLKSTHANAVQWITKIRKRNIYIGALSTISKKSLEYSIEIIDEYRRLKFPGIHLRELNFLGKAIGNWNTIGYDAHAFLKFWKTGMDHILKINSEGKFFWERGSIIMLTKILKKENPGYLDLMNPCGAALGQMAYNYDGNIYTCDEARALEEDIFKIGNTTSTTIPSIITQDHTLQLIANSINDNYSCVRCAYKPYCGLCPVCNYRETGSIITNVQTSSRCVVLKGQFDYLFEKLKDEKCKTIFTEWLDKKVL